MAGRSLYQQCGAALLVVGLIAMWPRNSVARDCTCSNIGSGICVLDPVCADQMREAIEKAVKDVRDVGATLEKTGQDAGKTLEKAGQDVKITIDKAVENSGAGHIKILATGYSQLLELDKEEAGYGLYSYAVLTSDSNRSGQFLGEVFKAIPAIEDTAAQRSQLNIFYLPLKKEMSEKFADAVRSLQKNPLELGIKYSDTLYDYRMARAILNHICNPPADSIRELCQGDMSRGPYIFTYARPASGLEPVPPPFLFVDLSDVGPRAFGEFIAAYRAQIKRDDITDGARINTLRLKILTLTLKAADILGPVKKAVTDIVHGGDSNEPAHK